MVVVVRTYDDHIDFGKLFKLNSGRSDTFGSEPSDGANALRPDSIGEDIEPGELNQKCRMVDESYCHAVCPKLFIEPGNSQILNLFRPLGSAPFPHHPKRIREAGRLFGERGIKELLSVKVVRYSSLLCWCVKQKTQGESQNHNYSHRFHAYRFHILSLQAELVTRRSNYKSVSVFQRPAPLFVR